MYREGKKMYGAFQKLLERYNKCIAAGGDYLEGSMEVLLCERVNDFRQLKWLTVEHFRVTFDTIFPLHNKPTFPRPSRKLGVG